jgi:Uma2 family endonuclease
MAMQFPPLAAGTTGWTVDMLEALPDDGNRYEIIDGELFVTPAPRWVHQRVVGALFVRIYAHLKGNRRFEALMSPADLRTGPRTAVQPDLFVIRRGTTPRTEQGWPELRATVLAVEVLSPSTARTDRSRKRVLYQREDIAEYWIVDADARVIERWRPEDERPEILAESIDWRAAPDEPALVIDLVELFEEVWAW